MTTTGDLFVNIKGNNTGLKRSLNQSSRDINRFSKQTEQTMNNGILSGLGGFGVGVSAAAASMLAARNQLKVIAATKPMHRQKLLAKHFDFADRKAELSMYTGAGAARHMKGLAAERSARRGEQAAASRQRRNLRATANPLTVLPPMATMASAVAAIAGTVFAANAVKWSKRVNSATEMYSSAVIKNKSRLELKNLRRDVQLAKDPTMQQSSIMRQNAADYRKNSGKNWAHVSNVAGSAWDYLIGWAGNAVSGSYVPDITSMTTEQRLAKVQGGAI